MQSLPWLCWVFITNVSVTLNWYFVGKNADGAIVYRWLLALGECIYRPKEISTLKWSIPGFILENGECNHSHAQHASQFPMLIHHSEFHILHSINPESCQFSISRNVTNPIDVHEVKACDPLECKQKKLVLHCKTFNLPI